MRETPAKTAGARAFRLATAAAPSSMPEPHIPACAFNVQYVPLGNVREVPCKSRRTKSGDSFGPKDLSKAATPATWGVAMLVPS